MKKVNCLIISRGVSEEELFSSTADLFKKKAFTWYLNNRSKFVGGPDLVTKLKSDFLPYNYQDYQDDLLEQIKSRKQGFQESVILTINEMEGNLNRLDEKPNEKVIVRIIRPNLLPIYVQQLALLNIENVSELLDRCKCL